MSRIFYFTQLTALDSCLQFTHPNLKLNLLGVLASRLVKREVYFQLVHVTLCLLYVYIIAHKSNDAMFLCIVIRWNKNKQVIFNFFIIKKYYIFIPYSDILRILVTVVLPIKKIIIIYGQILEMRNLKSLFFP